MLNFIKNLFEDPDLKLNRLRFEFEKNKNSFYDWLVKEHGFTHGKDFNRGNLYDIASCFKNTKGGVWKDNLGIHIEGDMASSTIWICTYPFEKPSYISFLDSIMGYINWDKAKKWVLKHEKLYNQLKNGA